MAATFKIEQIKDYTVMTNHHLRNKNLSLKAKGLQSLMLSLPDNWDYTLKGLAAICDDGVNSISSALKELESAGYVERNRIRNERGQLLGTEYIIYQIPKKNAENSLENENKPKCENRTLVKEKHTEHQEKGSEEITSPKCDFPVLDKPKPVQPKQENHAQLNIQKSITNKSITNHINPSVTDDEIDEIDEMIENIKVQIDYDELCAEYSQNVIDGIVDVMLEVNVTQDTVKISGQYVPARFVKMMFSRLGQEHIVYVLDSLNEVSQNRKIKNLKRYMLTALYNAPMTIDSYYNAEVNYCGE